MMRTICGLALLAVAVPIAAQQAPAQEPAAAQPAAMQPVPVPETMNDRVPPAAEFVAAALEASPRHGEWVDVPMPDKTIVRTWTVFPERSSRAPAVIVVHENRGLNDWARAVADQLAEDGFVAVAVDVLSGKGPGGGHSDSIPAEELGKAMAALTRDEINARLDMVRAHAIQIPAANGRVGMIGFCWGGSTVFQYAVHQPALNAGVIYYGGAPQDPELLDRIEAPLLGVFGEDDARVNTSVLAAMPVLNKTQKRLDAHMFPGAGHAFLRQQYARQANQRAAERAWPLTLDFLRSHLE